MPHGSNAALSRSWSLRTAGGRGWNTSRVRSPPRNSVACPPARSAAARTSSAGVSVRSQRNAPPPVDENVAADTYRLGPGRHRHPPQRFTGSGEERQRLLAERGPERVAVERLAAERAGRSLDSARGAREPDAQPLSVVTRAGDGHRRRRPGVAPLDRLRRGHVEREGARDGRKREHLQRDVEQHPEGPAGPGHQARHVVAGDVLHHLAAEAQHLALAVQHPGAEHEVACRARVGACRTGESGGDGAADGRLCAERGRLEREHLTPFVERGRHLRERRPAAGGEHELGGLVGDDAPVAGDVEMLRLGDASQELLGSAAGDGERSPVGGGGHAPVAQPLRPVRIHRFRTARSRRTAACRRARAWRRTRRSAAGSGPPCRG